MLHQSLYFVAHYYYFPRPPEFQKRHEVPVVPTPHLHVRGVGALVDAHHDDGGVVFGRGREDDLLGASLEVRLHLLTEKRQHFLFFKGAQAHAMEECCKWILGEQT